MPAKSTTAGELRIGISGWTYAPWRGVFYPKTLAHKNELAYASSQLNTIEINGTFYSLQRPSSFAKWHSETPENFVFSLKGGRYITHMKRLREIEAPLANYFLSGVLRLNEKLGPILWQFPPNMKFDEALFDQFLGVLPRTTKDAAKMTSKVDGKLKADRLYAEVDRDRPLRYAVEIRHESFAIAAFVKLLRKHGVALVVADTAGKWPMLFDVTADFVYVRLHGAEELYASGYTETALEDWAKRIRGWSSGDDFPASDRVGPAARKRAARDVFVYFDNDVKVHAPFDAASLAVKLGVREEPLGENPHISKAVPRPQWPGFER